MGFWVDVILLSSALKDDAVTSGDDGVAIEAEDLPGFVDAVVGHDRVVYDVVVILCQRFCVLVRERLVNRESEAMDDRHG